MKAAALAFLVALFARAPGGYVEIRALRRGRPLVAQEFFPVDDLAAVADRVIALRHKADVCVGVGPRTRESGTKDSVGPVGTVWVDCDSAEAVAALAEFSLRPSMVVASGTGTNVHAYWFLNEAIDLDRLEEINRRLAHVLGGDRAVHDAARVLRVPGTLNHKHDPPTEVTLVDCNGAVFVAEEVEAELPEIEAEPPLPPPTKRAGNAGAETPTEQLLERLEEVHETGNGWMARCPAHDDGTPSLSVAETEDGRCLVNCFAGCSPAKVMGALELSLADLFSDDRDDHGNQPLAAVLVDIVHGAGVVLFHDAGGTPYARVPVGDHHEVWTVSSRRFRRWLRFELRRQLGRMAKAEAVNEAVEYLSAEGDFDGPELEVYLRSAWSEGGFVFNLADADGHVVTVADQGWAVQSTTDVAFHRRNSVIALPVPQQGGSIDLLRRYVNVESDQDFLLILAWLVMALRPSGPYPVLVLHGEQGSAKSTVSRVLKALVEPVKAPIRSVPTSLRDLAIMAESNAVIAIDNLSVLGTTMSDGICRLSTGGGFSTRALYTDDEERIFEQMRSVILNGIDAIATRQDLLDRAIVLRLPRMTGDTRLQESVFWERFERDRPMILGALLDAAGSALANWDATEASAFRMADFARWASASMTALGSTPEAFLDSYVDNRSGALKASLEGSLVSKLVQRLLNQEDLVEGEPALIYEKLRGRVDEAERKGTSFPKSAQAMSRQLTLLTPALHEVGIEVTTTKRGSGGAKRRWITLRRVEPGDAGTRGTQRLPHTPPGADA